MCHTAATAIPSRVFGPAYGPSTCSGGVLPSISLKKAKLEQATCFTCSANERTPLNSPALGTKSYLDSGMASATPRNCPSVQCRAPPTLSAMFLGTSSCCAAAEIGIRSNRKSELIRQKQRRETGTVIFNRLIGGAINPACSLRTEQFQA